MTFTTTELTPRIGTEITADLDTLLSGAHAGNIRELLEQRGVLIFRDLDLDDDQQTMLASSLGELEVRGGMGVMPITLDPSSSASIYIKGSWYWHIDGTTEDVPNLAALLSAKVLSAEGGDTLFANTYAAYDDLADDEKAKYEGLRVVHSMEASQRYIIPEPSSAELALWQERKPKTHPLVWTHASGRKSLVLGCTAEYIEGMDFPEGRALLCKLREWATQPQFVYRHKWRPGDLLIWDNTGTMHRAEPYSLESGRLMHRSTLLGEESIA